MDIDQVVQVKSPTHRRAVDLPGAQPCENQDLYRSTWAYFQGFFE